MALRATRSQPGLIAAGLTAIAVGVLIFVMMVRDASRTVPSAAPFGGRPPGEVVSDNPPSRLWSVAGGLSLAAGFALIGVGMNQWTRRRSRG
jgi:hypothetical protein